MRRPDIAREKKERWGVRQPQVVHTWMIEKHCQFVLFDDQTNSLLALL